MNKDANTYWNNPDDSRRLHTTRRRQSARVASTRTTPWWLSFAIVASIFAMLLISINFRAFSKMIEEYEQHSQLSKQVQNLMDENLALQEEIHNLKTNREVIRREADRLGLRQKQVLGPTN